MRLHKDPNDSNDHPTGALSVVGLFGATWSWWGLLWGHVVFNPKGHSGAWSETPGMLKAFPCLSFLSVALSTIPDVVDSYAICPIYVALYRAIYH